MPLFIDEEDFDEFRRWKRKRQDALAQAQPADPAWRAATQPMRAPAPPPANVYEEFPGATAPQPVARDAGWQGATQPAPYDVQRLFKPAYEPRVQLPPPNIAEPPPEPQVTPWQQAVRNNYSREAMLPPERLGPVGADQLQRFSREAVLSPFQQAARIPDGQRVSDRLLESARTKPLIPDNSLEWDAITREVTRPAFEAAAQAGPGIANIGPSVMRGIAERGPQAYHEQLKQGWEKRPEPFPGAKGLLEFGAEAALPAPKIKLGVEAVGRLAGQMAKTPNIQSAARAANELVTRPDVQAAARRMVPGATVEDATIRDIGGKATMSPTPVRLGKGHAVYYRIQPSGLSVTEHTSGKEVMNIDPYSGKPEYSPGLRQKHVYAYRSPEETLHTDTSSQVTDWDSYGDELVAFVGKSPYDPGDVEGVAVKPIKELARFKLPEWQQFLRRVISSTGDADNVDDLFDLSINDWRSEIEASLLRGRGVPEKPPPAGKPMGVAPETAGAVGGLGVELQTETPDMTDDERWQRRLAAMTGGALAPATLRGGVKGVQAAVRKVTPGATVEAVGDGATRLPQMVDNYVKPLSAYTPNLYRETSLDQVEEFLPTSRSLGKSSEMPDVYMANTPELALGQGKNRGVLLEFDSADLKGRVNTAKPAWQMVYEQGQAELVGRHNTAEQYQEALRSVTIKPGATTTQSRGYVIRTRRLLDELESTRGWTKTANTDGSMTYTRPVAKSADALSGTPMGSPPEVGAAVLGGVIGGTQGETPEERARNFILGATTGGLGMAGARRGRMGLSVEDVTKAAPDTPLAKAAQEAIERAKGTAEQAAQLRAPKPGYAENVRLTQFPDYLRPTIQNTANDPLLNKAAGARRGVQSWDETARQAAEVATGKPVEAWLETRAGRAFNAAEIDALGQSVTKVSAESWALHTSLDEARNAGRATLEMEARAAEKDLELAGLMGVFQGARAEGGRALNIMRRALTGETASREKALMEAFKVFGEGDAYRVWSQQFMAETNPVKRYQMIQQLTKPGRLNQLLAWTTSNMLSSTPSMEINLVGGAVETIHRPLLRLVGGHPSEALTDVVATGRAMGRAWGAFRQTFTTGVRPSMMEAAMDASKLDNIHPEAFSGRSGIIATPALRIFGGTDEAIYLLNTAGELAVQARREARRTGKTVQEILANPDEKLLSAAQAAGDAATYRNEASPLAKLLLTGRNLVNKPGFANKATGLVVHVLAPFVRTPDVIYVRGTKQLLRPVASPIRGAYRVATGKGPFMTREEAARWALSTTAITAFFAEAVAGNLTGDGPKDYAKRKILEEARDADGMPIWQAHSIRIGGRWYDYGTLGPPSVPMAAISSAVEAYREEGAKPDPEYAAQVVGRTVKVLLDASYIRSIGDTFKSLMDGRVVGAAMSLVGNTAGRFVPYGGAVAQVARTTDTDIKDQEGPLQQVGARIPIVNQAIPARVGPFGEETQRPVDWLSAVAPARLTAPGKPNPVAVEVARLNSAGAPVSVRQFDENYAGEKQSDEQRRLLQTEAGKMAYSYIADTMAKPEYQALDDTRKAATLNKMLGTAYELADLQLGNKVSRDPRHQALLMWASEPHYQGVEGSDEEIRRENYKIANAKAKVAEYTRLYGPSGKYRLAEEDEESYLLARRKELSSRYLTAVREEIDAQFGGALTQAEKQGLIGAGNTILPIGGAR